jgi:uncharacterized Fe-S cluster protein YjdI
VSGGRETRYEAGVARTYATERIEVMWEPELCTHESVCWQTLPEVFDPTDRPWVKPAGADPDVLARTVAACPTGALRFRRLDGGPQEPELVGDETRVEVRRDGPLELRGQVRIRLTDGEVRVMTRALLCRCGASRNRPFCDNSHLRVGFRDPVD